MKNSLEQYFRKGNEIEMKIMGFKEGRERFRLIFKVFGLGVGDGKRLRGEGKDEGQFRAELTEKFFNRGEGCVIQGRHRTV